MKHKNSYQSVSVWTRVKTSSLFRMQLDCILLAVQLLANYKVSVCAAVALRARRQLDCRRNVVDGVAGAIFVR